MINKYEAVGIFGSIAVMVIALYLFHAHQAVAPVTTSSDNGSTVTVATSTPSTQKDALYSALAQALSTQTGDVTKLVIDDVQTGTGTVAQVGDTVTVNYIGTLPNGTVFDSSLKRNQPFTFTLGAGAVIKGWDKGVVGMKVGGKRILVIPADLAYGNRAIGSIPANSTLIFAIQLLDVKAGGKGGQ